MVWIRRTLATLAALLLVAAAALWLYTRLASPTHAGELRLAGLQAEVRIERDADGIPTVRATSLRDALYGLGVVHAQDRLWQLETHRRIGSGRLAEAFGAPALDTDRFLRTLGVRRAAAAQWAQTQGETRVALEAYAAGINAVVRSSLKARPPEMLMLGLQPEDWTPIDSLAWATMMAWDLGGNWGSELLRLRLSLTLELPLQRIDELLPPYPGDKPLVTADYPALFRGLKLQATLAQAGIDRMLAAAPPSGIEGVGSNNWVVAGSHSSTGHPLLANDPHLKLSAPALWYLARIEVAGGSEPAFKVAGATMPGLPLVVLGQNEHIAWGFTNTGPDVQDLYLERIQPGDATRYQTPDGWAAFATGSEVIKVKGQPDVTLPVRSTRHGPVISDAGVVGDLIASNGQPAYAIAMRWTALDADAQSLEAGLAFNRAKSVAEFVAASRGYKAPMQNMVVADSAGHIGLVAPGRVPLRRADNELKGLVPSPGWEARYDWEGWVPADETPREFDPPRGWIGSANQRIHGPEYPHFITSEWAAPYGQQRIEQLLRAKPQHSLESLREMQADLQSQAAARLLPWLKTAASAHPLAAAAQRELQAFNGEMAADKAAPLIVWAWTRHLTALVFADELGPVLYERLIGGRSFRDALENVLEGDDAWWCDDKATASVAETCGQRAALALGQALDELQAAHGADVSAWQWGAAHQARAEHRPFSRVKLLAPFFELRTPVGGDTYTLNVSRVNLKADATTGEFYLDEHGPSLRALYDVAEPKQSLVMHSSGQSGLPWSSAYRSFVERWARVDYVPLWGQDEPMNTLVLKPGG